MRAPLAICLTASTVLLGSGCAHEAHRSAQLVSIEAAMSAPSTTSTTSTTLPPAPPTTLKLVLPAWPKAPAKKAARHCGRTLAQIAQDESGHEASPYTSQNPHSTASGKYQVLDSTWGGFGGYARAKDAPPTVQEQQAAALYAKSGTSPWNASGC